jgi:hypothetical protein
MSHQCQQCLTTFTFKHNLKRHVEKRCKKVKFGTENVDAMTENVSVITDNVNAIDENVNDGTENVPQPKKGEYPCPKCTKVLHSKKRLKSHEEKCNGLHTLQCDICLKMFVTYSAKSHHKRKVKCTPPSSIKSIHTPSSTAAPPHPNVSALTHIYLIREREFIRMNEPIFKLGRSSNIKNRCGSYPKNSEIIIILQVGDSVQVEKELLKQFKQLFSQRRDIGDEYFAGDKAHMILTMCNHVYKDTPRPLLT